jgi:AraC family transcriptional regulator
VEADWSTNDPFINGIMPALLLLLDGNSMPDRLVSEHIFSALLSHVATAYGAADASQPVRAGTLTARQLNRLKQLLGDDLTRDVSLAELARECGLSPSHVSRTFKAATGMSPFAWRAQVRVDAGKELLRQGGSTISDIAAHCGFADQSHFTRTFQRLVGDSPKRWQRRTGGS